MGLEFFGKAEEVQVLTVGDEEVVVDLARGVFGGERGTEGWRVTRGGGGGGGGGGLSCCWKLG